MGKICHAPYKCVTEMTGSAARAHSKGSSWRNGSYLSSVETVGLFKAVVL
jgi:hypothetical protein